MPWSIFANVCERFTRNLSSNEDEYDRSKQTPPTQIWKSTLLQISFVRRSDAGRIRLCGHGPLELARASHFRPANNQLLAGCRSSNSVEDSLRRLHRSAEASSRRSMGAFDVRTVGCDDAGRTREISRAHVARLRSVWTAA